MNRCAFMCLATLIASASSASATSRAVPGGGGDPLQVELPTESLSHNPTNLVIPFRITAGGWDSVTSPAKVSVVRGSDGVEILGSVQIDIANSVAWWAPDPVVYPEGLEANTEYNVTMAVTSMWHSLGPSETSYTLVTDAEPAAGLSEVKPAYAEGTQDCHGGCCAPVLRVVPGGVLDLLPEYSTVTVEWFFQETWQGPQSSWGPLLESAGFQDGWPAVADDYCVRVTTASLLDDSQVVEEWCETHSEVFETLELGPWCSIWDVAFPAEGYPVVPLEGVLVIPARIAHRPLSDPNPTAASRIEVDIREPGKTPVAGTVSYQEELDLFVWRSASPLKAQTEYQLVFRFEQPEAPEALGQVLVEEFSVVTSAEATAPIGPPRVHFVVPERSCGGCCRPGIGVTYSDGDPGPPRLYRWVAARNASARVPVEEGLTWMGDTQRAEFHTAWDWTGKAYCVELFAHSLVDDSVSTLVHCEPHERLFVDTLADWCHMSIPPEGEDDDLLPPAELPERAAAGGCVATSVQDAAPVPTGGLLLLLAVLLFLRIRRSPAAP